MTLRPKDYIVSSDKLYIASNQQSKLPVQKNNCTRPKKRRVHEKQTPPLIEFSSEEEDFDHDCSILNRSSTASNNSQSFVESEEKTPP